MATSAEARRYQAYAARIRDAWRHGRLDAGQTRRLEAAGFEFEPRRLSGVVRIEDGRRFDTLKAAHDETGAAVGRISVAARSAQPWRRSAGGAHWIPAGRWDALGEQGRRRLQGLVEGERLRGLWVCAETGEAYDTMTLAAEAHGMPVSRLQKRNRLDRRNGGVHWVDGVTYGRIRRRHPGLLAAWRRTMRETMLRGPVVCVETGVEYGDAMRAAETLALTGRTRNTPGMRDLINHVRDNPDRRAGGFHWASPEWLARLASADPALLARLRAGSAPKGNRHAIRCVETGTIYPSLRAAAVALGLPARSATNIGHVAGDPDHVAYGYHWASIADDRTPRDAYPAHGRPPAGDKAHALASEADTLTSSHA